MCVYRGEGPLYTHLFFGAEYDTIFCKLFGESPEST